MQIENKKIWFIADFHFGHKNVITYAKRPFQTTSEMNNVLIKNYNKLIDNQDIVYILGDVSFLNTISTTEIIKSLHGFKFLIKGNHDRKTNSAYRKMGFVEVYDKPIVFLDRYILSHEPIDESYIIPSNFVNIYGHLHDKALNDYKWKYCVSVEQTNYKPVSFEEIQQHINSH